MNSPVESQSSKRFRNHIDSEVKKYDMKINENNVGYKANEQSFYSTNSRTGKTMLEKNKKLFYEGQTTGGRKTPVGKSAYFESHTPMSKRSDAEKLQKYIN